MSARGKWVYRKTWYKLYKMTVDADAMDGYREEFIDHFPTEGRAHDHGMKLELPYVSLIGHPGMTIYEVFMEIFVQDGKGYYVMPYDLVHEKPGSTIGEQVLGVVELKKNSWQRRVKKKKSKIKRLK